MESAPEQINRRRIAEWLVAVLFCLVFAIMGACVTFDWPCEAKGIIKKLFPALGFLALGSLAALLTAIQSALNVVKYRKERSSHRRLMLCVQRASRLEALFRMSIGATVGFGAYLLANMNDDA